MDAHQLEFKDEAFNAIVLPFVITLVSDPDRVLAEAIRVARPGGRVVLVNHFYSEQGLLAAIERKSGAALRKIGLNPEFSYSRIADYVAGDVRVCELTRIPAERFFTLVTIGRRA
jgi:phosphatidylethanolamine/phosphatidyl-N-methylethanolamine N-methyltransferase